MFDCIYCYYILLNSKIKHRADLPELGSQVIIFFAAYFPDVAMSSVDAAWAADNIRSGDRIAAVIWKPVILTGVRGTNKTARRAFWLIISKEKNPSSGNFSGRCNCG